MNPIVFALFFLISANNIRQLPANQQAEAVMPVQQQVSTLPEAQKTTSPALIFRKNKAHFAKSDTSKVHVVVTSDDRYHYRARNHKFKYTRTDPNR